MKRIVSLLALAVAAVLGAVGHASPAGAGGWVAVSLDAVPTLEPGEPTDVGFTVLRHGVTPESSDDLVVTLVGEDGSTYEFAAQPDSVPGHHVVTIEVPSAGDYTWSVAGDFVMADLGTVEAVSPPAGPSWVWDAAQWGGLAIAVVALAMAVAMRPRRRETVTAAPAA
jgi:hypothetical protein